MKKLTFQQYSDRKLAHFKKRRQRKKIAKKLDGLFVSYCVTRYCPSLSTYFYATYERHIEAALMEPNPFLSLIPKGSDYSGIYLPIPVNLHDA